MPWGRRTRRKVAAAKQDERRESRGVEAYLHDSWHQRRIPGSRGRQGQPAQDTHVHALDPVAEQPCWELAYARSHNSRSRTNRMMILRRPPVARKRAGERLNGGASSRPARPAKASCASPATLDPCPLSTDRRGTGGRTIGGTNPAVGPSAARNGDANVRRRPKSGRAPTSGPAPDGGLGGLGGEVRGLRKVLRAAKRNKKRTIAARAPLLIEQRTVGRAWARSVRQKLNKRLLIIPRSKDRRHLGTGLTRQFAG
ncbi:hypothetical protein B0T11DRAFT_19365 [Plectosphaerella cucumerina]|uniref:Uncharacterized protein n=1 Tax=Plectosphaerella cucumerina TaxID=40658 RepID=A0A8K0TVU0_9PEZI|nr:hypothetical protein B0T11DRAFT_19365 [Plectosphaerella cucumerina]